MLTPEEERALIVAAQSGDQRAWSKLIKAFEPLAFIIVRKRLSFGVPFDDLMQEANCGIMEAVRRFDLSRSNKLGAYARWWIRTYVDAAVHRGWSIVPRAGRGGPQGLRAAYEAMEPGRDVAIDAAVRDQPDGKPISLVNVLRADDVPADEVIETKMAAAARAAEWQAKLAVLTERERRILLARWPDEGKPLPLDELGLEYGLSRERIRQIEADALEKVGAPRAPNVRWGWAA